MASTSKAYRPAPDYAEITTAHYRRPVTCNCYFCNPHVYLTMPPHHTLCARCGELIITNVKGDPMNERLEVCYRCDVELLETCGR